MALIKETQYTYKDVTIVPAITSHIDHREECNPFYENGMLPLFTAPMDTVVNMANFGKFIENRINAIIPRTEPLNARQKYALNGLWTAFSLNEFETIFCDENNKHTYENKIRVLMDVANGHMNKILELSNKAKEIYGDDIIIMAGNIANPEAYLEYAKAGIDYIRCGIGSGFGCLSTSNTGVHWPMASLIDEIKKLKEKVEYWYKQSGNSYKSVPKIIADGGIRGFADIIKALALGADYVMIGSVFAKMLESAAIKEEKDGEVFATFYGMASREGQIALNGKKTKTSEGLSKKIKVEYTMQGWVENFTDYLRSSMSYTGNFTLDDFINKTNLIVNSKNAVDVVNK
jgi:IMP dehydrogenase/GMP reductase